MVVGPCRMSIGLPASMTYGVPSRLHHRIACTSRRACRSSIALVTRGSSFAGGTLRLSNDNTQKPEISRAGADAAARGAWAWPDVPNARHASSAAVAAHNTLFISVPGQLLRDEPALRTVAQPHRAEDQEQDGGKDRDGAERRLRRDAQDRVQLFARRRERVEGGLAARRGNLRAVVNGAHDRQHELNRERAC